MSGQITEDCWIKLCLIVDLAVCQRGFKLRTVDSGEVHYKVYKKTYCR